MCIRDRSTWGEILMAKGRKIVQEEPIEEEVEQEEEQYEQEDGEGMDEEADFEENGEAEEEFEDADGDDDNEEGENDAGDEQPEIVTKEKLITDGILGDLNQQPDLAIVQMRIQDILKVLARFKELRDPERPRSSYITELKENLGIYYGYNSELLDLLFDTFNPNELVQLLEANEEQRPTTIRVNTLKTRTKELAQRLIQKGVSLEPVADWTKVGLKIYESKVPIGATTEYLAGYYMLQSASSLLPVMALAPQMNERILDMAAAPGGKTTHIAQLMKNTGVLVANDLKKERLKSLMFNMHRMGATNSIIVNHDGRKLPKYMKHFDRVLLDAPCTGLGIVSRDPSIKSQRMLIDVKKAAHLQRELILAAIDCTKPGGYLVYSTCSILVEENEEVIDYALKRRFVKVVESGLEIGEPGFQKHMKKRFHQSLLKTKRIFPHIHNLDGFYVAKLRKIKDGVRNLEGDDEEHKEEVKEQEVPKKKKGKKVMHAPEPQPAGEVEEQEPSKKEQKKKKKNKNQQQHGQTEEAPQEEEVAQEEVPAVQPEGGKKKKKKKTVEIVEENIVQKKPAAEEQVIERKIKKKKVQTVVEEVVPQEEEAPPVVELSLIHI
eukprot:TRINITY_DN1075_c0_g1_i5.p1 TRINITY_DN1075_c0_g1~~TRINITY_DN1075_c0_g1_i5.p1  ORF type:complete len:606 (+),score=249.35 TRINITY_DN1075_c0_g1_i5:94-1911(+)